MAMFKSLPPILAVTAILITLSSTPSIAAIEVMEYACARGIQDRQPVDMMACKSFRLPSPVYLWIRLRGDAEALADLQAGKPIIIRHKWVRFAGVSAQVSTMKADEDLSGGQIDPAFLDRLRQEVEMKGYFDWRTWTYKAKLQTTTFDVEVVDKLYKPIQCTGSVGPVPCAIQVTIGE